MTETTFQWDPEGSSTQEFSLGIVNSSNKDTVESTTFIIENLTPGIPYALSANVTNMRTNQTASFETLSDTVWIESNIDELVFTKEHATLCSVTAFSENDQIAVRVVHDFEDANLQSLLGEYHFKYELFAESADEVQGFQTYELTIADSDEIFPLPGLIPDITYSIYYSLLVSPGEGWYHVDVHKLVGNVSFSSADRGMDSIDDENLQTLFTRMS